MAIMANLRSSLAIAAGKGSAWLTRRIGRGGTALPGLVASTLDPHLIGKLTRSLPRGAAVVTGTNGKTTTTRMISTILQHAEWRVLHNRSGSNLIRGLAATLVQAASVGGKLPADFALFEVDEAAVPAAMLEVQPRLLLFNNLFRDQLDRYGEVENVRRKWVDALKQVPVGTTVLLNADDPGIASLGLGLDSATVLYFGLDDEEGAHNMGALQHQADSLECPVCRTHLAYEAVYTAHVGRYHCPNCGFKRPTPHFRARRVLLHGTQGSTVLLSTPDGEGELAVLVPGLYNVYNALAATAASITLGLTLAQVQAGLAEFKAAFGRIERIAIGDKSLLMALVKNPVGFNEVMRMLLASEDRLHLLILINDLFADGRDVSWLWDVDFELLTKAHELAAVTTGGIRAEEMALRLKYAGVDPALISIVAGDAPTGRGKTHLYDTALDKALASTPTGTTLYVLPTYTAMLGLRAVLAERGLVKQFWEDLCS